MNNFVKSSGYQPQNRKYKIPFVEDTKLVKGYTTIEEVENAQKSLEKLYDWQDNNNMEYNSTKFQAIRLGNNEYLKQSTTLFSNNMAKVIEHFC